MQNLNNVFVNYPILTVPSLHDRMCHLSGKNVPPLEFPSGVQFVQSGDDASIHGLLRTFFPTRCEKVWRAVDRVQSLE